MFITSQLKESAESRDNIDRDQVVFSGLVFLIIPFLPASNLFLRVGFVVAERILYIPSTKVMGYATCFSKAFLRTTHQSHLEKFWRDLLSKMKPAARIIFCLPYGNAFLWTSLEIFGNIWNFWKLKLLVTFYVSFSPANTKTQFYIYFVDIFAKENGHLRHNKG